ncbi:MAG: hypothetical protein ACE366_26655 [Bradymonadia bacterium]
MKAQQTKSSEAAPESSHDADDAIQLDTGEATLQQSQELNVQHSGGGVSGAIHETASKGIAGSGGQLPHFDAIQNSFGRHDVSGVQSFTGGDATSANEAMGSNGYAVTGDGAPKVAFNGAPSLHTAAHEATHAVVGSLTNVSLDGGVGKVGDKYEQHADAVADKVVKGESAEGLIDQMAGGGSAGGASVQHQMATVQFDIKSDLREAMGGWGTDEESIFGRLRRASGKELMSVANDNGLMNELASELSHSEMKQVFRMLPVSVERKLKLAMDGWGTDESFIHETLGGASDEELARIAGNEALVGRLQSELSRDHMLRVLDRLPVTVESKLEMAMGGWGADDAYIHRVLGEATEEERTRIAGNDALVAQLRSELSHDDMTRIFDQLNMSVERKLDLAMDGWGTDEAYIHTTLASATDEELSRVAGNDPLVDRLEGELGDDDLRQVLERLNVHLSRKLNLAMRGWGTDEAYLANSIAAAPPAQVLEVAADETMVARIISELSGPDLDNALVALGTPYLPTGTPTKDAADRYFEALSTGPRRTLADNVITNSNHTPAVLSAFEAYWEVDTATEDANNENSAGTKEPRTAVWGVTILRQVHDHLKDQPPQDARNSVFSTLTLLADSGGATMNSSGNFRLGEESNTLAGTGLAQAASAGDTEVFLYDASAYFIGSGIAIGPQPSADVHQVTARDMATNKITLDNPLSQDYAQGVMVSDGSTNRRSTYGVGTQLRAQAASGQKELVVRDVDVFDAGDSIMVGRGGTQETHTIATKDEANNKYTLQNNLANNQNAFTPVTASDGTGFRRVNWLEAVVRHEIAHSVDTAVGGVTGFTQGLGGWQTGTSFDDWASAMGNPWQTNDGSTISEAEKTAIKNHIDSERGGNGGHALNNGLDATHAINKYWNKGVPVIEAAKPCVQGGKQFWTSPQNVKGYGGNFFTINHYYHQYHYYNESVQTNRVRDYSIFSPAEFFAEVYTVYYEEAGQVADSELGRLVPVASWRNWLTNNIHNRNMDPTSAQDSGNTSGGTGMKTGDSGE